MSDIPEQAPGMVELSAQPCLAGDLIRQGLVRDTYYDNPPLVALDPTSLDIRWIARRGEVFESWGNLRSPPAIVGDEALFATAYSSKLSAVSLKTGIVTWCVDLGQELFEQWSGPIASGRSIFLGRHDGYLHKISCERHRREWSIYLGDESCAGAVVAGSQRVSEFADSSAWTAGNSSPIWRLPH